MNSLPNREPLNEIVGFFPDTTLNVSRQQYIWQTKTIHENTVDKIKKKHKMHQNQLLYTKQFEEEILCVCKSTRSLSMTNNW